jgi:hypothetical protein
MAKDGKHVIHAGGVFPNPLLNREGAAAAATCLVLLASSPPPSSRPRLMATKSDPLCR